MPRTVITPFSFVLLVFLMLGCDQKPLSQQERGEIVLTDLNGSALTVAFTTPAGAPMKSLRIPTYHGKILFVDFFSTSCGPCRDEVPHLVALQEKYKDDMVILGVLLENKTPQELAPFIDYFGINYPVSISPANRDMTEIVGGVRGIPAMYLYDKEGRYVTHYLGAVPEAMIENDIQRILNR